MTRQDPAFAASGIANYDFTSAGATLVAGESYWIVAYGTAAAPRYDWKASSPAQTPTGLATHLGSLFDGNGPPPTSASSILCSYSVTAAGGAAQENILLLNDECGGSAQHFPAALANLGLDFTETTEDADFYAALTGGTAWDVVIVDAYRNPLAPATITELQSFIAAGGRLYVDYYGWDYAPDLASALGASVVSTYNIPITIYRWNAGHALFTTPNAVPDLVPSTDTCVIDGARFNAVSAGVEVAGYTLAPTAGEHAVIVGNGGRTVLYGGILGLFSGDNDSDGRSDGLEFAENVVNYLVAIFSDGFESGDTTAWSATVP